MVQDVHGKRVTVAGLGRFGGQIAAARWLAAEGASVLVTDQSTADKLEDSLRQLQGLGIQFQLGEHRQQDFIDTDLVVASPAIPPTSPYLRAASEAGIPITSEIRLFIERCPATIIGVTGTKGKSTTTAMLGEMLKGRYTTWVGGNIGRPLLGDLHQIDKTHLIVLELSSFMLDDLGKMRWSPHISVVTMVAKDHLDWHGSAQAYIEAKKNIVRFQRPDDFAVLNDEDPGAMAMASATHARIVPFSVFGSRPLKLLISGTHNQSNAQAAFAAAHLLGVEWEEAQEAVRLFAGLPHRLQLIHEDAHGVRWVNDSIATIPEAAVAALESFPCRRVIQIVGGKDKGLSFVGMCNALVERAKAALCIGATGKQIEERMSQSSHANGAAIYYCGDLKTAVQVARQIATGGDVVLLSTGCASQDQFVNFQERGDAFSELARSGE